MAVLYLTLFVSFRLQIPSVHNQFLTQLNITIFNSFVICHNQFLALLNIIISISFVICHNQFGAIVVLVVSSVFGLATEQFCVWWSALCLD